MHLATYLIFTLSLTVIAHGYPEHEGSRARRAETNFRCACDRIAAAISNASEVYFPSTPQYLSDIFHFFASSSQESACSVEPGSADDVSKILSILGSTCTPFAVKSGGYSSNPGFSSTRGVQISMTRFKNVKVDSASATVEVGAGCTWDQVYSVLDPYEITVVGGGVPGIGVGGCALGGGYSWKSNEYGLTIDNIVGYELVLPNGTIKAVTSNDEDLWFGLRGGLNNFGIVTKFIFKSYPQGRVWAGPIFYSPDQLDTFKDAVIRYQDKNDPKALAIFTLIYSSGTLAPIAWLFYDAPMPPQGIFDDFLAMPYVQKNVSSRSFYDFVLSMNAANPSSNVPIRTYFSGFSVARISVAVFDAAVDQINFWSGRLSQLDESLNIATDLHPLDSDVFSHGSASASPPDRSEAIFSHAVIYQWTNASLDHTMASAMRKHTEALHNAALADGQNVSHAAVYVNYALFDTPLEDIYGANVPRLRKIRSEIDPEDVMGLTGGFKF